mgnify:CR=1 FL=1
MGSCYTRIHKCTYSITPDILFKLGRNYSVQFEHKDHKGHKVESQGKAAGALSEVAFPHSVLSVLKRQSLCVLCGLCVGIMRKSPQKVGMTKCDELNSCIFLGVQCA